MHYEFTTSPCSLIRRPPCISKYWREPPRAMPRGQILNSLVSGLALSFKSHLVGFALAYAAVLTLHKFSSYSSALRKIRKAPSVKVSGLRSNPALDQSDQSDAKLIVVRGIVEAKSAFDRKWNSFKSGVLVQNTLHFQRTQSVRFVFFYYSTKTSIT